MKKEIRVALTSSLVACGLTANMAAQSDTSQTGSPQRAIPARRFENDPVLRRMLPAKPASTANKDSQSPAQAAQANSTADIIEFDAPGAGTKANEGTYPYAINAWGEITGFYEDSNGAIHGFLRYWDGEIKPFDPPDSHDTYPVAINLEGEITGYYYDANISYHGFLRDSEGHFTTVDVPGAGTALNQGTTPVAINDEGAITGSYCGGSTSPFPVTWCYGFVRSRDGAITTFDPSNSTSVFPEGIDDFGVTTGGVGSLAFLRDWNGDILTFAPPSGEDAFANAINPQGVVAGYYVAPENNAFGYLLRGFLRNLDGSFATFDAATYSPCCIFTIPEAINLEGAITGYYNDGYNLNHGFVRSPNGSITTFDAPDAGTGFFQGTLAWGINLEGAITGYYIDANNVYHGFVRIKK